MKKKVVKYLFKYGYTDPLTNSSPMKSYISATGSYLPSKVLTNKDLESMVETTDEWIMSRTGIKERRIAEKDQSTSDLGVQAAKKALASAKMSIEGVDLIICATLSPDFRFPSTACLIQQKLKAACPAFDISAACSGMIYALSVAKGYIASGLYQNILVVGAEKVSSVVDYSDRSTCVLFGDGAAASLVTDTPLNDNALEIGEIDLGSDGSMHEALYIPSGGSLAPRGSENFDESAQYLKMEGKVVFRHAVQRMTGSIAKLLEKAGLSAKDIDYFIPHQANQRILEALLKRFAISPEKVHRNVDVVGNACGASIGICLDERFQKGTKGLKRLLMTTFGAGFTWGSMLLKEVK